MTGSVPVDWQLTDTYFVVAHIHYVLIGWNLFPVMGAHLFLVPEDDRPLARARRLGRWNFWMMFIGFNLGFFPMHITGLLGMPRRIYTYPEGMGWDTLNLITTIGSFIFAARHPAAADQRRGQPATRPRRRPQSLGCGDPRMVDPVAAAALQFRRHSDRREPASALGRPARRERRIVRRSSAAWCSTTARRCSPRRRSMRSRSHPEDAGGLHPAAAAGARADALFSGLLAHSWWIAAARRRGRRSWFYWSGCGQGAARADRGRSAMSERRAGASSRLADRQRRSPLGRLVGDVVRHPHRSRALRLSAVQLLLLRHPAARRRVAARADGARAVAAQHRHPARSAASRSGGASAEPIEAARGKQLLGLLIAIVLGAGLRHCSAVRMEEPAVLGFVAPLWLALLHHHRLPHGARRGRADDPAGAPGLVGARLLRTASAMRRSRSGRSIGISSTRSGSRCSSPST